jgi:hypothetical protein
LTASRFNCAMTESSMFNVVFIWKTIPESRAYGKARQTSGVTLIYPSRDQRFGFPHRRNPMWDSKTRPP